jgi:hypothetical protein
MLAIHVSINLLYLFVITIACFCAGLLLRLSAIKQKNERIGELEKEMLRSHAEIISLCQTIDQLRNQAGRTNAPVFKLKDTPDDKSEPSSDKNAENISFPRVSSGKK